MGPKVPRTKSPQDKKSLGPKVPRTKSPKKSLRKKFSSTKIPWTKSLQDKKSLGQKVRRTKSPQYLKFLEKNSQKKIPMKNPFRIKSLTCDFSIVALYLSHIGEISKVSSRSLSPCLKNSSIILSTHLLQISKGFVGFDKSEQCTIFCRTYICRKIHITS